MACRALRVRRDTRGQHRRCSLIRPPHVSTFLVRIGNAVPLCLVGRCVREVYLVKVNGSFGAKLLRRRLACHHDALRLGTPGIRSELGRDHDVRIMDDDAMTMVSSLAMAGGLIIVDACIKVRLTWIAKGTLDRRSQKCS